jgi:hypothetical protein
MGRWCVIEDFVLRVCGNYGRKVVDKEKEVLNRLMYEIINQNIIIMIICGLGV